MSSNRTNASTQRVDATTRGNKLPLTAAQRNRRVVAAVVGTMSAGLLVAGCGPMLTASAGPGNGSSEARIAVSPAPGGAPVEVAKPVVITADKGRLVDVAVVGAGGTLPGTTSDDGKTWTSLPGAELAYDATYQVQASAVDSDGKTAQLKNSFQTINPAEKFTASAEYIDPDSTVGVGMPVAVKFDMPITDRAAVEKALVIKSSKPVEGAWSWNGEGTEVTFRPKEFWPADTAVHVSGDLYGVKGTDKAYGADNVDLNFKVGSSLIMKVDANTLQMIVERNGQVVQTLPVTTGKPGFETRSGIKVISAKEGTVIMDSATTGTPAGSSESYRLEVNDAMRLTESGEFIHAAPWSTYAQGSYSVSHGCIGLSSSDADWLYGMASPGDVVVVTNTGRETDLGNGITAWNEPWEQWLKGSATGPLTTEKLNVPPPAPSAPAPAPSA